MEDEKWVLHADATLLMVFHCKEAAFLWYARQPDPVVFMSELGDGIRKPIYLNKKYLCLCPEEYYNTL